MKIVKFAVRRPVTIAILVCVLIILGAVSFSRLAVDLFPEMKFPIAAVITSYTGAGPEEIENQISKPIEEAVGTLSNIESIQSISSAGSSWVIIEFNWGTNMENATMEMREKLSFIEGFLPSSAEKPMVIKMDPAMMPIIQMGLSGDQSLAELQLLAEDTIQPRLERLDGVASVYVTGGNEREVKVSVDPVRLEQNGVAIGQIAAALNPASENFTQNSGTVESGNKHYFVRTLQQFESVDEIRNVMLSNGRGFVRLSDIADITEGYKETQQYTRVNGRESIGIHIQKQSDANTVEIADQVEAEMKKLEQELPGNVHADMIFDQSDYIKDSLNSLERTLIEGALLAMVIVFFFLRNVRSTGIIFTAIPLSIIATFAVMYFSKMTLNMITLGGLALGVGRMIDDSIVVLESIYRHRAEGEPAEQAAISGATEVGNAVIASTLTAVGVFAPIVFVTGIAAVIFKPMAMTVSVALLCSLVVALTIIPLLASRLLQREVIGAQYTNSPKGIRALANRFGRWIDALSPWYRNIINWSLSHRRRVILIVTVLMIGSFALIPLIGAEFIPASDAGQISVSMEMDKGAVLGDTDAAVQQVEKILDDMDEVTTIFTSVGSVDMMTGSSTGQTDTATLMVILKPKAERDASVDEVCERIREQVAGIPGTKIGVTATDMMSMGSTGAPVTININGDDLNVLRDLSNQVADITRQVPGAREVESSLTEGSPEIQIRVDRQKAALYGLSPGQVASNLKMAIEGSTVSQYRVGGEEVNIRVQYADSFRENINDLGAITIQSPMGMAVPLSQIASFETGRGPVSINRVDQVRNAQVTAYLSGRSLAEVTKDIKAKTDKMQLPSGYSIEFGGQNEQMTDSFSSLAIALLLAIILVYAVMAIQYESFFYPLVIMFSLPTIFIGVVISLAVTGKSFSVVAFIGIIMLVGIAVANAIVLVDYIKQLRERGLPRAEAIADAGAVRLRPILMTALATILALLPVAIGIGEGAETMQPMGIVVIGGLFASTVITLVLVPVMYTILDDLAQKWKDRWKARNDKKANAVNA